jgi:predicted DNA binding CopG/RHH family protein
MKTALDIEEKELIAFYKSDKWVSISTPELIDKYKKIASNTLKQKKVINVEISSEDFNAIQNFAVKKGSSYQELAANVLHNYAIGNFKEEVI